jgi:fumarate hydratase class II
MATTRIKRDSFGTIEVPANRLWGAQTQRSLVTEMEFDQWVQPEEMLRPGAKRLSPD